MGRQAVVFNRSLAEMAKVLNSSITAGEKLHSLVQLASRALGVRGCSLMLLDAKKRKLIHAATYGLSDRYVRAGPVDVDKSLPEIMPGKTALVVDAAGDPGSSSPGWRSRSGWHRSWVCRWCARGT